MNRFCLIAPRCLRSLGLLMVLLSLGRESRAQCRLIPNPATGLPDCISPSGCGGGGSGTVTSVALSLPAIFSVSGSPVTTSGTLAATLATQAANIVLAGPSSGASATPNFRPLTVLDLPLTALSTLYSLGASGSAKTVDPVNGWAQTTTLSANCTITLTQPASGTFANVRIGVTQAASGGPYTVTFTGAKWPGGVAPVMTATANGVDWYACLLDGTNSYCTAGQDFQ